jgi:predicted adenylyl cyclase CyaB
MPLEIEIKLALPDLPTMERKLRELHASPQAVLFETNIFFDWPDDRLKVADQGLRLRIEERLGKLGPPIFRLTCKGPRQAGELKTREEIELLVDDAGAAEAMLKALGLDRVLVFEKLRRVWRLDDCEVTLDTLPQLGDFMEIEGPTSAAVRAAQATLALRQPIIPHTYLELLLAQQSQLSQRPHVFAFAPQQRQSLRSAAGGPSAFPR